jgi:hypothetical protein
MPSGRQGWENELKVKSKKLIVIVRIGVSFFMISSFLK